MSTTKTGEGVNSKQRMMLSFVLFLAFPLCSVIANCPSEPKGQNSIIQKLRVFCHLLDLNSINFLIPIFLQSICIIPKLKMRKDKISLVLELKEKGKYNCACFVNDTPTTSEVQ